MSRKDYELIAASIARNVKPAREFLAHNPDDAAGKAILAAHTNTAHDLADALRGTNPRFDRSRFIEACGL